MNLKTGLFVFILTTAIYCQNNYTQYVDPFIGTGGHGHTFPGATLPFGMVQLSPDTDIRGWDWCSGYHFSDNSLMGFSHTHLSGTGGADYGDILLLPIVGETKWQSGTKSDPDKGYRSRFFHDRESARPGYYQVYLQDYNINVELTTTKRVGVHKYTFPATNQAKILVDLQHGISDKVRESYIKVVNHSEIEGLRRSRGWASDQYVYFVIRFSKPFKKYSHALDDIEVSDETVAGKNVKGMYHFQTQKDEVIYVKVGISAVSTEGARKNLETEVPDWNFEQLVEEADKEWNQWLNKIQVEDDSEDDKKIFYTALYHSLIAPNLYMDVDGKYRGRDLEIHQADGFNYYTLFSLWDTFRAAHPLFTLIAPDYNRDFIRTMILQYEQGGDLPIWELSANETGTMIGYHSIPVIVDAFMKGQRDFDAEKAYEAMKHSSMRDYRGLRQYRNFGFIPSDQERNSVSKCLEYAYDDWCIASMAKELGKQEDYATYIKRSQYFINHFDPETKFMRGRFATGLWRTPFDPRQVSRLGNADFTEGNSWQYTFFVPHNVNTLMQLAGGQDSFVAKLDKLFSESELPGLEHSPDVSGLIGNYAHGNEPSHHIAYLYNYAGQSWKTQEIVHKIKKEMYTTKPSGLAGNEDCGQMSAWYVFSAMGFYPVGPGDNKYVLGTPTFDKVILNLPNDKNVVIASERNSGSDFYIQHTQLNGKNYPKNYLLHSDLVKGMDFKFALAKNPNKNWGTETAHLVKSQKIEKKLQISRVEEAQAMPPYFNNEETLFCPSKVITLSTITSNAEIRYTLDGSDPDENALLYTGPFRIEKTVPLKARTFKNGFKASAVFERQFVRVNFEAGENLTISLKHQPHPNYNKGGNLALLDKKLGSMNFRDGKWQGFEYDDMDATIDLGKTMKVSEIRVRFFQAHGAWIVLPASVECLYSNDGENFKVAAKQDIPLPNNMMPDEIREVSLKIDGINTRYIRIIARNQKRLPKWHGNPGGKSFLFCDEIIIENKDN